MESDDPSTAYRRFIEYFSNKIDNLSQDEFEPPFRLSTFYLVPSEVEGECLEWTRRYLCLYDCPYGLLPQLTRAVYKHFQSHVNLSHFYIDSEDKESSNDEDDDDNCDNNSQASNNSDNVNISKLPQIFANKLLQEVVSHVHSVVKDWARVTPPLTAPPTSLHVCSHAIKNTRRKMEDRHVIMTDLNTLFDLKDSPSQAYFAVFDGHGGLEAADYAASQLHLHLVKDDQFDLDPASAMKHAYKMTDLRFLEKAARENLRCGTTGVSVLIRDSQLYIGWLGDSQALLVRSGQAIQVMNPHKPEREDERRRIEDLGGCVLYFGAWRVNGNISVSRAIGDAPHKPFISNDADVTTISMTGEEEYLVLACDGLWDVLSPAQVTQIVYKHSHTSPGGLDDVAIGLVNAARDAGSSDNISVVVVLFKSSLSVPQTSSESGLLLGLSTLSERSLDQLNNSSSNSSNLPKPPTLNEKLKSKGSSDLVDGSSSFSNTQYHSTSFSSRKSSFDVVSRDSIGALTGKGNIQHLSADVMSTPFSHELMRQAMFYIAKKPKKTEDACLVEMALQRAMSGEKIRKKHDFVYERKSGVTEPTRPNIRSIYGAGSQGSKVKRKGGRKRQRKRGQAKSVAGETSWGVTSESEEDWSDVANEIALFREGSTASLGSLILNNKSKQKNMRKLKPLNVKGNTLAAAAIAEARWLAEKNKAPSMELSGSSLPLSSRTALPRILQSRDDEDCSHTYESDIENSRLQMPYENEMYLNVPATMKPHRGMSTLSDNILLNAPNTMSRFNSLKLETSSQLSDRSVRSRRGTFWHKK